MKNNHNHSPMNEEKIIETLQKINPVPGPRFYRKMQKTPWNSKPTHFMFSFQAALVLSVIAAIFLLNPIDDYLPVTNTYTPTATYTTTATLIPQTPGTTATAYISPALTPTP